ncbi:MAG: isoamylase early set domain-containing protein [Anaerolineales bacterium]|nr:isoamylase early set domain-containing protein [Anaerolineales bacterium]MCB8951013.1 isoamylase early set domain-containing protein [Ardenticatenales bacterium]
MLQKRFFKTKDECEVTFQFTPEDADQVVLVCEQNGWNPIPMTQNKAGAFRAKVRLPKGGEYQFRYLVDGVSWYNDEAADAYRPNEHGGDNGVVFTYSN